MIIPISDTQRIKSLSNQWAIQRKQKRGRGRTWESVQFYSSPESAITAAFDIEIRELPDHLAFVDAIAEIKNLQDNFKALLTVGDF